MCSAEKWPQINHFAGFYWLPSQFAQDAQSDLTGTISCMPIRCQKSLTCSRPAPESLSFVAERSALRRDCIKQIAPAEISRFTFDATTVSNVSRGLGQFAKTCGVDF